MCVCGIYERGAGVGGTQHAGGEKLSHQSHQKGVLKKCIRASIVRHLSTTRGQTRPDACPSPTSAKGGEKKKKNDEKSNTLFTPHHPLLKRLLCEPVSGSILTIERSGWTRKFNGGRGLSFQLRFCGVLLLLPSKSKIVSSEREGVGNRLQMSFFLFSSLPFRP